MRGDAELVAASLDGDRGAFGILVDRWTPRVVALVRRMLGDVDEAEDVTQEAVLRAYLGLAALRRPTSFGGWLCGIALNVARMRVRQERVGRHSLADVTGGSRVPLSLLASPDQSPERIAEAEEDLRAVRDALEILPAGQREVVLLHYVDGLSCEEIAALLGTTSGAVRVRLHRARRRLRERLSIHYEEVETVVEVVIEDVVVRVLIEDADAEKPRLANERVRVVVLREKDGDRMLPIWVGPPEGDALALQLAGESMPRPMTADLMARLMDAAGARIERVVVSSLRENTFYAIVVVGRDGQTSEVDARPSDAFNLALRVGAPIFVDSEVMTQSAVVGDGLVDSIDQLESKLLEVEGEAEPPGTWRSLSPPLVKALYPPFPARK